MVGAKTYHSSSKSLSSPRANRSAASPRKTPSASQVSYDEDVAAGPCPFIPSAALRNNATSLLRVSDSVVFYRNTFLHGLVVRGPEKSPPPPVQNHLPTLPRPHHVE